MAREIQKADPEFRRRVVTLLGLVALAAVLGVLRLEAYLGELRGLAAESPHEAAERTLAAARLFLTAIALGAVLLAGFLGRLSWRTLRAGRFPPPGARVINDTPVVRGRRARRYDRAGLILALLVLVAGLAVPYRLHRGLRALLEVTLAPTYQTPEDLGVE